MIPMDTLSGNNYPQLCFETGLNCHSCAAGTARTLAQVCKGLRGKMIGQLFVQIHPHSACAPMHAHFARSYRAFSGDEPEACLSEPQTAAMAAVA